MKATRYIATLITFGVCLCILGIGLIIAGSLSFESSEKDCKKLGGKSKNENGIHNTGGRCVPSDEAQRVDLYGSIERVMHIYYLLYPNKIIWHPYVEGEELKRFRLYNCTPAALKNRTDVARQLYLQVKQLRNGINETALKARELKALIQLLHYLKTDFGQPYGENYYAGDWMLGPSRFCAEAICRIGSDLYYHFNENVWSWQPSSFDDVTYILQKIQGYKPLIQQYIANIKYGITAGMVRSTEQCEAGYYSFVSKYRQVSAAGESGILKEWFTRSLLSEEYLKNINQSEKQRWFNQSGNTIHDSIHTTLVRYFGKPIAELLHFLKYEYRSHCVPSNVSSGLATLPLKYIYTNGTKTPNRTTQTLPFGEKLNGSKAYESILYFYTTSEHLTPDQIYELGKEKLRIFYQEAINVAENETRMSGKQAVIEFKKVLNDQSSFFNDAPFPINESNEIAFTRCTNLTQAKIHCPKRHEAFQKWSAFVREILSLLEPKTIDMFHFTGRKRTTPSCPLRVIPNFNPKTGSQSYMGSDKPCRRSSRYRLPFFMDNLGPKYNAFSVAGHEGRPGHHTQIQGYKENFYGGCNDELTWLDSAGNYPLFSEGWGLYAENPLLASGTNIYDKNPLQKYGMLKWQIWRAIRLIVDTGLHYKGMKRYEALAYHEEFAWDTTDKATKDVTRYQSNPGQATAYMIGQLEIWTLRQLTKQRLEEAGKTFVEKDFHYQVLSQGMSPMEYLKIHINKYIECVLSNSTNCDALATGATQHSNEELFMQRNIYKKNYPVENYRDLHEHFD